MERDNYTRANAAPGEVGKALLGEVVEEDFTKFLSSLRSAAASKSATEAAGAAGAAGAALSNPNPSPYIPALSSSSRTTGSPHYPFLNIPSLDNLLYTLFTHHHKIHAHEHHPHEQSASSFSSSAYTTPDHRSITHLPSHTSTSNQPIPPPPPSPPAFPLPFIELASTAPCAGKTHLLYYICAVSVLPHSYDIPPSASSSFLSYSPHLSSPLSSHKNATTITLNGKNSMIVILDTDNRFDVFRLRLIIKHYILTNLNLNQISSSSREPPWLTSLIQLSLSHIHIFRPITSSSQLYQTLLSLPNYLYSLPPEQQNRRLAGVLVDSMSAFHWEDRCGRESSISSIFPRDHDQDIEEISTTTTTTTTLTTTPNLNKKPKSQIQLLSETYTPIITYLHQIQSLFGCFIVVTRRMYLVPIPSASRAGQYLPHKRPRLPSPLPQNQHSEQEDEPELPKLTLQSPLPNVWTNAVMLRILLQRSHSSPAPAPPSAPSSSTLIQPTFTGKIDTIHPLWGGSNYSSNNLGGKHSINSTTNTASAPAPAPREITYWIGRDGMGII